MLTRRSWIIGVGSAGLAAVLPPARGSDWPQFRGPDRKWHLQGNRTLTQMAGSRTEASLVGPSGRGLCRRGDRGGRVYHHDYDEAKSEWIDQLPLAGRWQADLAVPRAARDPSQSRDHPHRSGGGRPVRLSLDPKAVLHCLDAKTGKQIWRKSLVEEYQATIPSWYNGQNPLQEGRIVVIIATGGAAILVALDKATGKEIWRTPNPQPPVDDVARFGDAGRAGRSPAISLWNARRPAGRVGQATASCCGNSRASSTWPWRRRRSR
jgi:outer membrane protein assembly factor BamB